MKRYRVIYIGHWGIVSEVFGTASYEKVHDIFNDLFRSCTLLDVQDEK